MKAPTAAPPTPDFINADGSIDREKLDVAVHWSAIERNERDLEQAGALWKAGWTAETHRDGMEIMSYYWRRPGKRTGKPGRLFLSTSQAHSALLRESHQNTAP